MYRSRVLSRSKIERFLLFHSSLPTLMVESGMSSEMNDLQVGVLLPASSTLGAKCTIGQKYTWRLNINCGFC